MELLPLKYAASTMSKYHFIVLALVAAISLWNGSADRQGGAILHAAIAVAGITLVYFWIAPIVGQAFGDKFTWSQVWPSGFIVALLLMAWGNLGFWLRDSEYPLSAALFFLTVGTSLFGLVISASFWLMPRVVGSGVVDFAKKSWGVSL